MCKIFSYLTFFLFLSCNNFQTEKKKIETKKQTARFEKIIFHTSSCSGRCDVQHLEIDYNKKIRVFNERIYSKKNGVSEVDYSKMGYFTGMASDTTFNKLLKEFDNIKIDTLTFDGVTCCDGIIFTVIVYYDGKKKILQSMDPPKTAINFLNTLGQIASAENLTRTVTQFEIENFDIERVDLKNYLPPKITNKKNKT